MRRIEGLDYLRGISAFLIMIYHYQSWITNSRLDSSSILSRFGVYGVSIFYILSGLTLYLVYNSKTHFSYKSFYLKRLFRIYPLLILVTILHLIIGNSNFDLIKFILNITGLFGIFAWDNYYATGAWSIGNELVFYLIFPFMLVFAKRSKTLFFIAAILFMGIYCLFSFKILDHQLPISQQWRLYINPMNQAFLFIIGMLIGFFANIIEKLKKLYFLFIIIGMLIFVLIPSKGDSINIVTGLSRITYTISITIICLGFYMISLHKSFFTRMLTFFGEISYSIYLLHPIVYILMSQISKGTTLFILSILLSIVISHLVYKYFEIPIIKSKLLQKLTKY